MDVERQRVIDSMVAEVIEDFYKDELEHTEIKQISVCGFDPSTVGGKAKIAMALHLSGQQRQ